MNNELIGLLNLGKQKAVSGIFCLIILWIIVK